MARRPANARAVVPRRRPSAANLRAPRGGACYTAPTKPRRSGVLPRAKRALPLAPTESAKAAKLRYVDDSLPGIHRFPRGKGFTYRFTGGGTVKDPAVLARIRALVIPPAWRDVWICAAEDGHVQATGRDARGRKQYRYHARFREIREETKFERMLDFAAALPRIRAKVDADMRITALSRERVLATLVRLLEITLIRIGNEEYARENASFGLTTLRTRHVDIAGQKVRFRFRGKSGVEHAVSVHDRRVARVVARCTDLPGQLLFQYLDDAGDLCAVDASDVNAYLRAIDAAEFTTKEFRTWAATVLAATSLHALGLEEARSIAARKANVVQVVKDVARRLGNTAAVCRKCYIHPEIVEAYLDGVFALEGLPSEVPPAPSDAAVLATGEVAVLAFLKARAARRRSERQAA